MKLKFVRIINFRSIQSQQVQFDEGCQVLVGINESGKSNVLRALALLAPQVVPSQLDVRIEKPDEPTITESYVRFVFDLDENEREEIYDKVRMKFDVSSVETPILELADKKLTLRQFCHTKNEGLYDVEVSTAKKRGSFWALGAGFKCLPNWHKITGATTESRLIEIGGDVSSNASGIEFFNTESATLSGPGKLTELTAVDVNRIVGAEIINYVNSHLPTCVYWNYSEENLLPSQVNSKTFAENPESCLPLKSMFELAGYSDIRGAIGSAQSRPPHIYTNLLDKVAHSTTQHIRRVWRDYRTVTVQLRRNGDLIEPIVTDKQIRMDFSSRSDGFKRFVSFLLLVSGKIRANAIENTLLLVDEPEVGLHPSGARSLLAELIEIGKTNRVVFSTHSVFMIDKENIERHVIVEKNDEVTELKRADPARITDEEVLYNAIGYSLFEVLKKENIVFEGWRDKELFRVWTKKHAGANKNKIEEFGKCHAMGVKDIPNVSRFLSLTGRGCLIVTDSDGAARQHKRTHESNRSYGKWVTYEDIVGHPNRVTAEDFVKVAAHVSRAKKFRTNHHGLSKLEENAFLAGLPRLDVWKRWIAELGLEGEDLKRELNEAKGLLFDGLKADEVEDEYQVIVDFIVQFDFDSTVDR